ncbi:hypothetical protein IQ264_27480 [Phormidium sp. LEGE 05292]|uniref:hypothetical protein n=1 Tax=[Phormidium] sp. LEGE 05292 TaxID=767427 RepID=UPI00187EE2B0|nr:hypothetical protein [Phormidium sp. LEGE 05292]MBE9229149.1 hypothetical protein [Phormidium sp. LEGE 05292]
MKKKANDSHLTPRSAMREGRKENIHPCPNCLGTDVIFIATQNLIHEGKLVCGDCGRFIKWTPKRANQVKQLDTQKLIAQLLASGTGLSKWEVCFLWSVKGQKKLSPKQRETLNKIANGRKL